MTTSDLNNDTGTEGTSRKGKVFAAAGSAAEKVRERASGARTKASDAYSSARDRTSELYGSARERASGAYDSTRQRTAEGIESNPAGALIAGLAIGAIAAALLPKTRRETEAFGKVGSKINQTAREAARAAKEAGRGKLDELGLNADTAKQRLSEVASTSANAAAQRVKGSQQA